MPPTVYPTCWLDLEYMGLTLKPSDHQSLHPISTKMVQTKSAFILLTSDSTREYEKTFFLGNFLSYKTRLLTFFVNSLVVKIYAKIYYFRTDSPKFSIFYSIF